MILPLLLGCAQIQTFLDVLDEMASATVADGIYVGTASEHGFDWDGSGVPQLAACETFLAYVSDADDLAQAPVEGAEMDFLSEENGRLRFLESGDGIYGLTNEDGLVYTGDDEAVVTFTSGSGAGTIRVRTLDAPSPTMADTTGALEGIHVDAGADYDNLLVAVYDISRAKVTWTNLPEGIDGIYDYTHPEAPSRELDIPGDAFQRSGLHVVGVAGMRLADPSDFEGVNQSLSAFMAGEFAVHLVSVTPLEEGSGK